MIDEEGHDLLNEGVKSWHDPAVFTDDKVAQVKWSFQRWLVETALSKSRPL